MPFTQSAPGMPKEAINRKVPRGERRREELIDVAQEIFFDRGFPETTMQMIAEAAGASKETLYRHFESKELLFAEIVSRKARAISGPDGAIARGGSPDVVLSALGTSLLTTVCTGPGAFLFRTVVAEAARTPELGDLFFERGPGATVDRLTQYLADATKRDELHCDDPAVAARLFLGAVAAQFHLRRLLQSKWKPPTASEIERHVKAAVSMFLKEFGPRRTVG
jgi:TetR/AcrR family transcriptional regulator, mexJK operon transcriptional repressor